MSTIIGAPTMQTTEGAIEAIQLYITAKESEWLDLYTRIELWRSTIAPAGPFIELTAGDWSPAVVPAWAAEEPTTPVAGRQVLLEGKSLILNVEGYELTIHFTTANPYTYAQSAQVITTKGVGRLRAYVDVNGALVLMGTRPGTGGVLQVVGGDAAPLLGLPTVSPENVAYGRDARIGLIPGNERYTFVDLRGRKGYFYRTRFRNDATGAVSEFSAPFSPQQALGINPTSIVCGLVYLARGDGSPLANQLVQVYTVGGPELVEGRLITGPKQAFITDAKGYVEFMLIRGVKYSVSIAGTDLVREVVAPIDPAINVFNLLDPKVGAQNDFFKVVRPLLAEAERRTL